MNSQPSQCYYEILGVEQDATDSEIKRAFRKASFKWHPDRNRDQTELATKMFQQVRDAYETLKDPQERAWYDSHRDQILGLDSEESSLQLDDYFKECWTSFNDSDSTGFYSHFQKIFKEIDDIERKAWERVNKIDPTDKNAPRYPSKPGFGTSQQIETVNDFYLDWEHFTTFRTFALEDLWRTTSAENKYVRKAMEKENQEARAKSRKHYVETVRKLASFAKKHDPRIPQLSQLIKKKQEDVIKRQKLKAAQRLESIMNQLEAQDDINGEYIHDYEDELKQIDQEWEEYENQSRPESSDVCSSSSSSSTVKHYCTVCKKSFNSQGALETHENSKAHKKKAKKAGLNLPKTTSNISSTTIPVESKKSKKKKKKKKKTAAADVLDLSSAYVTSQQSPNLPKPTTNTGGPTSKLSDPLFDDISTQPIPSSPKSKSISSSSSTHQSAKFSVNSGKQKSCHNPRSKAQQSSTLQHHHNTSPKPPNTNSSIDFSSSQHICVKCLETFSSRSKLFKHLKATGHAASPDAVHVMNKSIAKKKKKKKKKKRGR